jgi:putative spermidine/putrescine transport system permease protein
MNPQGRRTRLLKRSDASELGMPWGLIATPGTVVLMLTFGLPMGFLLVYSVFQDAGSGQVVAQPTLANYLKFVLDPFYLRILFEMFLLSFIVALLCAALGYPVAYVLARTTSRWRGLLIFFVAAPLLVSVIIRNLGWLPILGLNGLVNKALLALGILDQPAILLNNQLGVVIGLTNALLPLMILSLMTVIQRIHPTIEEAANNLGASWLYSFFHVVFPLSLRGLLAGFVLVFTVSVSSYTTPAVLGGGHVLVMSTFIEQQVDLVLAYAFSAACSIILMFVVAVLTLGVLNRLERHA